MQFRVTNKLPQMLFTEMNAVQKVNVIDRVNVCLFDKYLLYIINHKKTHFC